MPRHKPLEDEVKSATNFVGIVNTKRSKDIGHKALTIARNVDITDTKKITRRSGRAIIDGETFVALYGKDAQDRLYGVKGGSLVDIDRNSTQTVLTTGLVGDIFSWDEDPNNNVYYCSNKSSSGIITNAGVWQPIVVPVPVITSAGVIDPGTWEYRPFALGKRYNDNMMQVMATYVMADGRESAPSETVSVEVTPEVRMLRVVVPPLAAATRIYATAPGGSTYYLAAITINATVTVLVSNINMLATGAEYPYSMGIDAFPTDALLLCFYRGRLCAAAYDATSDMGALYMSLPLQFHLFDKSADFLGLSSVPLLLLPHSDGQQLIIGTSTNIYNYDGERLTEVANYGVIPGICGDTLQGGNAYFWTARGVAKAMPYELLTEQTFSGDPGVFNHARMIYDRGYAKLVASTVSGNPTFNAWSER